MSEATIKMKNDYKVGELVYDARNYDSLNSFLDDLPFYLKCLPADRNIKVLEVCCGTGRLTIPIAEHGYDITGVDIMSSMLQEARRKAYEANVRITFIEADIRYLAIGESYDVIIVPFNSIHHLYSNDDFFKAFVAIKQHMKKGALLLFDCFNPDLSYISNAGSKSHQIASFFNKENQAVKIFQQMKYESSTQVNRIKWNYFIDNEFDSTQDMDMRLYFPQELDYYLESAGFEIVEKFGGFDKTPFDDSAKKQIYICRNPG